MLTPGERAEATEIQASLARTLEEIRADTGLTDREKRRQMARMVLSARDSMHALRADAAEFDGAERTEAFRTAFGIDPNRAAEERTIRAGLSAESPGPVEIAARLQNAIAIGDWLAAKVLGAYAYSHKDDPLDGGAYKGVLNQYADISPSVEQAMIALRDADAGTSASGDDRLARFQDKIALEISVPSELSGGSLDAYAADDDPAPASPAGMPFGVA
jgi:hypothetical protein